MSQSDAARSLSVDKSDLVQGSTQISQGKKSLLKESLSSKVHAQNK